jgi:hypothetical protein
MRFLKIQVLLLLLAVVVVGALGADVVLKNRAETELVAQVTQRVPGTTGVEADISSFPFVGRLLISGTVPKVVITAQHADSGSIGLSDVRVVVEEVEMDSQAARDGKAVVKSIGRGSVQADLRANEINPFLPRGYRVDLQPGKATVSGPGASLAQFVTTPEGAIQLRVADRALVDLPFPKTDLLPCAPAAEFVSGAVRLTCSFDEVPPLLLDLAQQ